MTRGWGLLGLCLVLGLIPEGAHAQAWTRDAGSFYLDLGVGYTSGKEVYRPDFGRQTLARRFTQVVLNGYAEVGLVSRWLTLTASSELVRLSHLNQTGRTLGVGDSRVGLWTGLVTAPFRLTLGAVLGVPTGDPDPDAPSDADTAAQFVANTLPTGDGEWDLEPQIVAGWSFGADWWPFRHYLQGGLGYHIRTRGKGPLGAETNFADAITYRIEAGAQPRMLDRVWLSGRFYGVESFASDTKAAMGAVGLGNGVTYTAFAVRLYVRLVDNFGVAGSVEGAIRARSILASPVGRLAFSYERP